MSTATSGELTTLAVDGGTVTYSDSGEPGPAVLLVHAGIFSSWFVPLTSEPALTGYRMIRLVRAGYGQGPAPQRPLSITDHARHCAAVLDTLDTGPALVVGHSSGSMITLELARERPDLVAAMVLGEPPLLDPLADPADLESLHATLGPAFGAATGAIASGDLDAAYEGVMALLCGPGHRAVLESALGPDGPAAARQEVAFFLTGEVPAAGAWVFDEQRAATIHQPVLLVQGGASIPQTHRLVARLARLLPDAHVATIEGDNHLLPLRNPSALAELINGFAGRRLPSNR